MDIKRADVGVIIARFQIHKLHDCHKELINYVKERHSKMIIFLGIAHIPCSINNPLDFEMRKQMIQEDYPDAIVLDIKDDVSDEVWSKNLDSRIRDMVGPGRTVCLYGGRDSFLPHYKGSFDTHELESETKMSATEIRNEVARRAVNSADFRAGVIHSSQGRFPSVMATVDMAILNHDYSQVLLGRRANQTRWRFPGGFSEPDSDCYEFDAKREIAEETGLEVSQLKYIGSKFIDDWRYKNEPDKVKTLFFRCTKMFGAEKGADDIAEVKWFYLNDQSKDYLINAHKPLWDMLIKSLKEG